MYGDRGCNADFANIIDRTLSTYLQRTVKSLETEFDNNVKRWIYKLYIDVDKSGYLEPIKCSAEVAELLRRLVTHAYSGSRQAREYLRRPWIDSDLLNGGTPLIEVPILQQGGFVSHTFWTNLIHHYDSGNTNVRVVIYYWIIRGWSEVAKIRNETVVPPKLNDDGSITIYIREVNSIHDYMLSIKGYMRDGLQIQLQIAEFYHDNMWDEHTLTFRAQQGHPLMIGSYGVREIVGDEVRDVKQRYLDWLYPCIDDEDLSWSEFGRIIKHDDQCHALGETPEDNVMYFMKIARPLALAGIYPLGPFDGLLPWPNGDVDINRDRRLLGLSEITQLTLT